MILSILNTDMSKHFETVEKIAILSKRFINENKMIMHDDSDSDEDTDRSNENSKLKIAED